MLAANASRAVVFKSKAPRRGATDLIFCSSVEKVTPQTVKTGRLKKLGYLL
jgi:hypothetical protein